MTRYLANLAFLFNYPALSLHAVRHVLALSSFACRLTFTTHVTRTAGATKIACLSSTLSSRSHLIAVEHEDGPFKSPVCSSYQLGGSFYRQITAPFSLSPPLPYAHTVASHTQSYPPLTHHCCWNCTNDVFVTSGQSSALAFAFVSCC